MVVSLHAELEISFILPFIVLLHTGMAEKASLPQEMVECGVIQCYWHFKIHLQEQHKYAMIVGVGGYIVELLSFTVYIRDTDREEILYEI